jgi:hypothetical protein
MKKILTLIFLSLIISSCTEPYGIQTNTFEDALVIEATITNELKKQEIKISRTFTFEESKPKFESNAIVYLTDDLGNIFNFNEENGKYISEFEFEAIPNRRYKLYIITSNGKQYTSTTEILKEPSSQLEINSNKNNIYGVEGVEIIANSFDPTGNSKYYRFEYEETYKIKSPKWTTNKLNITYNHNNYEVTTWLTQKDYDSSTCYNTVSSNEILLVNTSGLNDDKVADFSIRFLPQNNHIIAYRYSILVKQYVQNLEAHTFYKTLKDFSSDGSILSPNQPGFIEGNINNISNKSEKVIGFFDVSSVSEKRIFFNYNDFFEGEAPSKYHVICDESVKFVYSPSELVENCEGSFPTPPPHEHPYCEFGKYALYKNVEVLKGEIYVEGNYITTIPICGECNRAFSTNVPDFWID